jgi:hypothetical protein
MPNANANTNNTFIPNKNNNYNNREENLEIECICDSKEYKEKKDLIQCILCQT